MPRLSIVIVTFNSRRDITPCLAALQMPAPAVAHEIIVVDNASTDGTTALIRERWAEVRVIDAGGNLGFARANNLGIQTARGDLVLLLNPDTEATGLEIDRLVTYLDAHANAGAVGPRIVDGDGRAELSFGRMIGPFAEAWQKLLVRANDRAWPLVGALVARRTRQSRDVDWVSGACLLARRTDLEAVGLLDERFFLYTEDVDLCASLRSRGKSVHFLADTCIVHHRGRSAVSAPAATREAYRRSHLAFYEKHHPRWTPLLRIYLKSKGQLPDRS